MESIFNLWAMMVAIRPTGMLMLWVSPLRPGCSSIFGALKVVFARRSLLIDFAMRGAMIPGAFIAGEFTTPMFYGVRAQRWPGDPELDADIGDVASGPPPPTHFGIRVSGLSAVSPVRLARKGLSVMGFGDEPCADGRFFVAIFLGTF